MPASALIHRKLPALGIVIAGVLATLIGCEQGERPASSAQRPAETASAQELHLDGPLILWRDGRTDEALAALQKVRWDDPQARFTLPVLTLSEAEFAAKSLVEQSRLRDEALGLIQHIRAMSLAALEEADRLQGTGQPENARNLRTAIRALADRLSSREERLAIFNAVGDALQRSAASPDEAPAGAR